MPSTTYPIPRILSLARTISEWHRIQKLKSQIKITNQKLKRKFDEKNQQFYDQPGGKEMLELTLEDIRSTDVTDMPQKIENIPFSEQEMNDDEKELVAIIKSTFNIPKSSISVKIDDNLTANQFKTYCDRGIVAIPSSHAYNILSLKNLNEEDRFLFGHEFTHLYFCDQAKQADQLKPFNAISKIPLIRHEIEKACDRGGALIAPNGCIIVFETLMRKEPNHFFLTHPSYEERLAQCYEIARSKGVTASKMPNLHNNLQ